MTNLNLFAHGHNNDRYQRMDGGMAFSNCENLNNAVFARRPSGVDDLPKNGGHQDRELPYLPNRTWHAGTLSPSELTLLEDLRNCRPSMKPEAVLSKQAEMSKASRAKRELIARTLADIRIGGSEPDRQSVLDTVIRQGLLNNEGQSAATRGRAAEASEE